MFASSRRNVLATSAALGAVGLLGAGRARATAAEAVRRFRIDVPQAELTDLRRRLAATRWPDRETVADASQGVPLARIRSLVQYWQTKYDWCKVEAQLNALPQFVTEIDGLDIQFAHIRSPHADALPMVMTHGWPGSVLEFLKVVGPLTEPTAFGGGAGDAFHLVLPSIPGYGFSERPGATGWGPERTARAWTTLMRRLGYDRWVSQGGDHGSVISDVLARQRPPELLGIHLTMPATVPPEIARALAAGDPAPAGLAPDERDAFDRLDAFYRRGSGYSAMMVTRPQTLGYGLTDSPAALVAWFYDKFAAWTDTGGVPERALTVDEMLDDISLYWLTNTAVSSARFYWENNANNFNAVDVAVPTAITVFPGEIYRAPLSWAERSYRDLIYWSEASHGGHFAAWEVPEIFVDEMRAAFRPLRG